MAHADVPDARARALALAEDAAVARSRGDLDRAIALVKEALALHDDPALVYNLGRLYEDAEVLDLAQHHYARCLEANAPDAVKERAQKGLARVAEARHFGRVQLTGVPDAALVAVDDAPAAPLPAGGLKLPAGSHRVVVTAPGYAPVTLSLDVPGGRVTTRAITLEPRREAVPAALPTAAMTSTPHPWPLGAGPRWAPGSR